MPKPRFIYWAFLVTIFVVIVPFSLGAMRLNLIALDALDCTSDQLLLAQSSSAKHLQLRLCPSEAFSAEEAINIMMQTIQTGEDNALVHLELSKWYSALNLLETSNWELALSRAYSPSTRLAGWLVKFGLRELALEGYRSLRWSNRSSTCNELYDTALAASPDSLILDLALACADWEH